MGWLGRLKPPKWARNKLKGMARGAISFMPGGNIINSGISQFGSQALQNRADRAASKGSDLRKWAGANRGPRRGVNAAIRGAIGSIPGVGGIAGGWMDQARARGEGMSRSEEENILAGGFGRRRRLNPGNVQALRRSMRRVESFARLAKKTIHFVHTTKLKSSRKARR